MGDNGENITLEKTELELYIHMNMKGNKKQNIYLTESDEPAYGLFYLNTLYRFFIILIETCGRIQSVNHLYAMSSLLASQVVTFGRG